MDSLTKAIIDLWHISRTALATSSATRYDRMIYVKQELIKRHADLVANMSAKRIWFAIEEAIS